jgi:hypothetical protein
MKLFSIVSFLLWANVLFGQITLPVVPEASKGHVKIKGAYVPRDKFAKTFPDFLKNGVYSFDIESDLFVDKLEKQWYRGLSQFNSNDFPVEAEVSTKSLAGLGKVLVQLTTDGSTEYSKIWLNFKIFSGKEDRIKSRTDLLKYSTVVDYTKGIREDYDILNASYRESATGVLNNKHADSIGICDVGALDFDSLSFSSSNVILQFVFVQGNAWARGKTRDRFPSHVLYRLIVRDASGEIIKTYNQAIFFEGKGIAAVGAFPLRATLSVAMENLINRFLNDEPTAQMLRARVHEEIAVRQSIPHYDSLFNYSHRYSMIRSKKQQLLFDLSYLETNYAGLINSNKEREAAVLNRDRSLDNNVVTSTIAGAGYGSWARAIRGNMDNNQKKLFILQQTALSIQQEEKKFVEQLSGVFTDPFDLSFVLGSKDIENNRLNGLLSKLTNKRDETFNTVETTSRLIDKDFGGVFTNNINSFISSAAGPGAVSGGGMQAPETAAMTNGGSSGASMDACQQQAMTEAYKSQEYANWKRTGMQSDASMYKAKMIELTLKYCRDKLLPNEVQSLTQAAENERKVGREIRAAYDKTPWSKF